MPPAGVEPATCRASTGRSYQTELQGRGTCAPTRIRAGGRRARSSDGGNRTRDPGIMRPMLYQLSYARIHAANSALMRYVTLPVFIFVPAAGLEPTTSTVSEWRSHQLNHTGKDENKIVEGAPHAARALHVLRRRRQTNITSDERRKQNPRRSSAERFLFSSAALPRIELGQPK